MTKENEKESKKNLKQKLIEVSKSIGYLQKDKTNKMQGYKYLSEAMIKKAIKEPFEKQEIVFNYSTNEISQYEISPTHKGTKQFCTIVKGTYSFIDVDSEERIDGSWIGSGTDTGDKGLYKAITGGVKYILNTNFLIPTGDDPENDDDISGKTDKKKVTEPKVKSGDVKFVTEKQLNKYYAMIKDAGLKEDKMDKWVKKHYKVEHKKELAMAQIDEIFKKLEKRIAEKKEAKKIEEGYNKEERKELVR